MMKTVPRALPLLSLLVLAAIWMGGCESIRMVESAGMLGTSLLVAVIGALIIGVLEFGSPRRL
jgi:hypothetical protein